MSDNDRSSPPPGRGADNAANRALAESTASIAGEKHTPVPIGPAMSRWGALERRRTIAAGTFSTVYLAWDPALEREVALKVMPAAGRCQTAIQEGRLLA